MHLKPQKKYPLEKRKRLSGRRKAVTICIAAICEQGAKVVTATDGALSLGGVRGDPLVAGKMLWFNDWLLLWAGEPGNIDLVLENMRQRARTEKDAFSREHIRGTVNRAFKEFAADWAADGVLPAYNMDIAEFKKKGRGVFGDPLFKEISKQMNEAVKKYLTDEMLVVGWGKSPISAMLHQRSAIGS